MSNPWIDQLWRLLAKSLRYEAWYRQATVAALCDQLCIDNGARHE